MTDTMPQPENPPAAAESNPGPAPSGEHRPRQNFRRRRKRRGQGQNSGQNQNQNQAPGQNAQNVQNPQNAPASNGQQPASQGRSDNPSRKQKKRFFRKNRSQGQNQNDNPGNGRSARGNGQQRRNNKQRRPKVFVGPMDHSYRAVNGNYSDAPPSTIELQRGMTNAHYDGNGNGNVNGNVAPPQSGYGQNGFESGANSAVQENAPTRIYCFIDDLFFTAKIQETARKLGIKVAFVKNDKETVAELLDLPEEERPALVVFDLNSVTAKPLTLIPKFKTKFKRATSIVGFLSHLQGELKVKALDAGCDTVMPRSAFSQSLPNLLRRYGIEVEIEDDQRHMLEA